MRPSDMDAIARVVAQQVKEIVDKKLAGITPPETKSYDDEIGDLQATIEAQSDLLNEAAKQIDALSQRLSDMEKADDLAPLRDRMSDIEANLNKRVTVEELGQKADVDSITALATDLGVAEMTIKQLTAAMDQIDTRISSQESVVKTIPDASEYAKMIKDYIDGLELPSDATVGAEIVRQFDENWRNVFAAMLPDEVDLNKAVEIVHDTIMKELPEMVLHAASDIEPPEPLAPTDMQVMKAVEYLYPAIRHDLLKRIPVPVHKGLWQAEVQYDVGDEVVKNGSTFRLMELSSDAPPSDAWQMVSQGSRGKQGKPGIGKQGEKGEDGVGISEVALENGILAFQRTDGTADVFDLDLSNKIADAVTKFMLDVRGENDGATS